MKRILVGALIILSFSFLLAQPKENVDLLSNSEFSIHGGVSFISLSQGWGAIMIEGKSHLSKDLLVKLSFGYSKIVSPHNYTVNSHSVINIDDNKRYSAISYEVYKTEYLVIPISLGFQYNINYSTYNPYVFTEIGYNLIDPLSFKNPTIHIADFSSYGDLPLGYRNIDILPNGSYKLAIGVGFKYPISSIFGLDLRYLTQIDSEIINSQQLLVGITF